MMWLLDRADRYYQEIEGAANKTYLGKGFGRVDDLVSAMRLPHGQAEALPRWVRRGGAHYSLECRLRKPCLVGKIVHAAGP